MNSPSPDTSSRSIDAHWLSAIIETQNDIAMMELDLPLLIGMIAERTQKLMGADGAIVELIESDALVCRAVTGTAVAFDHKRINAKETSSGLALSTGQVVHCVDTLSDESPCFRFARSVGVRSLIAVPLNHAGSSVGVLKVIASRPSAFTSQHVSALRLMAGVLAAAIAHASEFESKKRLLALRTDMLQALNQSQSKLRESEARFRSAFDHAAIGIALVSLEGRFVQVNSALCDLTGYSEAELLVRDFQSITYPDDLQADLVHVRELLAGEVIHYHMEKRYIHRQGHLVWVMLSVSLVRDETNRPLYFIAQIQDVTEQKLAQLMERDQRAILEMIARNLPLQQPLCHLAQSLERQIPGSCAAVMVLLDGDIVLHGPSLPPEWLRMLKSQLPSLPARLAQGFWDSPDACGVTSIALDSVWQNDRALTAKFDFRASWTVSISSNDAIPLGLITVFSRLEPSPTARQKHVLDLIAKLAATCIEHFNAGRQMAHLVHHDTLTGLPNRMMFNDRLLQTIALARRGGHPSALLLLDIDRFKTVNDTLGHQAGDELLQHFAMRLRGQLRESDTFARLAGDEFAVLLPKITGPDEATAVARKLVASLMLPFEIAGTSVNATTSIGIALFPANADGALPLQNAADAALYRAKANGRNCFAF